MTEPKDFKDLIQCINCKYFELFADGETGWCSVKDDRKYYWSTCRHFEEEGKE